MTDAHTFQVGDIVMAYNSEKTERWIGWIDSINSHDMPVVWFWNPRQKRLAATRLTMQPTGLTFIGRPPADTDMDPR